jgi:hypothetical protein
MLLITPFDPTSRDVMKEAEPLMIALGQHLGCALTPARDPNVNEE